MENAHGVGAAADAGDHRVGLARHSSSCICAIDSLPITDWKSRTICRIGMRPGDRADDVEGVADVGHPVAHRFVERVLERLRTALDRHHGGAEQLHAIDVGGLPPDVLGAHVDDAFHAVARGDGGRRDAVLAGAGFGDDARLAHAPGQHRLADAVVDLVRAGVVEVFALEVDLRAAEQLGPTLGVIDRARAADVMLEVVLEFGDELRVALSGA